jgi:predicted dehydrogenase
LNDLGPHIFDLLNYLFDDYPAAVSAFKTTFLNSPVEEFSTFIVEYPGGRSGIGKVSWLSSTVTESISIYGTAQNLFASPNFLVKVNPIDVQEVALWRAASESLLSLKFPKLSFLRIKKDDPYQREIDYFIRRIREGGGFSKDALNALSVLAACKATQEAAIKRCRIEIAKPEEL